MTCQCECEDEYVAENSTRGNVAAGSGSGTDLRRTTNGTLRLERLALITTA
jgi:hypothetical protein